MTMYRIMSQTKSGYPDSHGYYYNKDIAEQFMSELSSMYKHRDTKFFIREVN